MSDIVEFNNHKFELIKHNGQDFMTLSQVGMALEYANPNSDISNIYRRNKSEFTDEMSCTCSLQVQGQKRKIRIFNRDGAWLIGMFARTPKAAEFRKWVLKVLGAVADNETMKRVHGDSTTVREHTRSLPSGKKDIVLSAKAREEIGGITKDVVTKTLDEKLPKYFGHCDKLPDEMISAAFHQTVDEMQAEKALERKDYQLSEAEAEIIEKIRSVGAFNMLNLYMGVSKKLSA